LGEWGDEWIEFWAYTSFGHLVQYVEDVIKHFGVKYKKTPQELLSLFEQLSQDYSYQFMLRLTNSLSKTMINKGTFNRI